RYIELHDRTSDSRASRTCAREPPVRMLASIDPERLHEHEKPRAPEHKPEPVEDPAAPLHELVSGVGNQAFGSAVARQGHGIMASGEVTPDVQSTINSSRGSGQSLDSNVASRLSPSLGDLSDVRVHT